MISVSSCLGAAIHDCGACWRYALKIRGKSVKNGFANLFTNPFTTWGIMSRAQADNEARLLAYLATGVRTSEDIQERLNLSQPSVSRLISRVSEQVVIIGNARTRRYTIRRDLRGLGGEFPVFRVDEDGNASFIGALSAIGHDEYLWQPKGDGAVQYKSLPWFLSDLQPDGFTGRAFVRRLSETLSLPLRIFDWTDDHVLVALAYLGEDLMGNLIIGQQSLDRYFSQSHERSDLITHDELVTAYPTMAKNAMEGQPVGSSAGGEQPKFTVRVDRGGEIENLLVKFSPPVHSVEGRRWADLLICEHIALDIVGEVGIAAVKTSLVVAEDRVFLEVTRFDRVGRCGRLPMISLRAIDNEFYGRQDNWVAAADRMEADGRLTSDDARNLRWLWVFGDLIANTDKHFGNVSLASVSADRFTLRPAYDMLPMLYRPMDGAAPELTFKPPVFSTQAANQWDSALTAAATFWERAAADNRISERFRQICDDNLAIVRSLEKGPRLIP
ncbi:type II toxin-antitoxin system HipA family toxin YjjJ [Geomonas anaerohicana]|uniref:Type II toxin-antitoxin system HipA family toxin YjjJ n=1 Tax=Geomonas anaerohicana TaxID=2798583 RepID=A0ABS0YHL0_9BACT|nr:type II toxin-antitoxin system HipA family toxin YjjJ [Geomonas anaerohicana]MBJ6751382.1 type II toxin-antitoxin system HipA family toxin YjjJ [Geomonas anaerohicana]